jgi:DNA-binding NarL/FixJ family response regulator
MGGARGGRRALSGDEVAASMRRASGTAVKAIAVDRGVSAAAASTWLRRAMGKLLLTTSADLVLLFGGWPRGIEARRQGARGREWLEVTYPVHGWPLPACLTPAERRVVAALVAGCPCATIAAQGQIAARTVANQLASAYRKLGVGSSVELFVALHRHASEPTKSD